MTAPHPPLRPDELHIWWLAVPPPGAGTEAALSLLDPRQRERAARPLRPLHRHRRALAHAGLRVLLGACLRVPPQDCELYRTPCPVCGGPHGRPRVAGAPGLEYSMAHTGDHVVYGLARLPVGVDAERFPVAPHTERAVTRWLPPGRRRWLESLPAPERAAAFARCWVRTEARAKAVGAGLAHGVPAAAGTGNDPGLLTLDLTAPDGVAASAVLTAAGPDMAAGGRIRVRTRTLTPERILDAAAATRAQGGTTWRTAKAKAKAKSC